MRQAIGGYNELELRKGEHYHKTALRLNTARNCFEYILRAREYKKVYIPYYTCEVMLEPICKLGVDYEFYNIDIDFEPIHTVQLKEKEAFLYTNYYGLKQSCAQKLSQVYGNKLIIDNAQAFFATPIEGIDTFYSCRKFFGVPDGAYLYTDCLLDVDFEQDYSYDRMSHLLKRIDLSAEEGYKDFQQAEESLCNQPIRKMSKLTERILETIDYEHIKHIRRENYKNLFNILDSDKKWDLPEDAVPLVYPHYTEGETLRNRLIKNRIFAPVYWHNVLGWCSEKSVEYKYVMHIIPLPIDQRYGEEDTNRISTIIKG